MALAGKSMHHAPPAATGLSAPAPKCLLLTLQHWSHLNCLHYPISPPTHTHCLPQVRKAIDSAPHLADEAVDLGLVDGALFRDQAVKVAQRLAAANTARLAVRGLGEWGGW